MHDTIARFKDAASSGDDSLILPLLAPGIRFRPPTYYSTWTTPEAVSAVLGHVGHVFQDFKYRRIMGDGKDWALEFQCKIGDLDAVGVDLITLDDDGLIEIFEVAMRPLKSVQALREAMNERVSTDARFLKFRDALISGT